MITKSTTAKDDFFAQWKAAEACYIKELTWVSEVKKLYEPETLSLKRKAIPEGKSKAEYYTSIINEAWQRAQRIKPTYLIVASEWLPMFAISFFGSDFTRNQDIGTIQGSHIVGTYRGLPMVVSPALESFEMLWGADTTIPNYNIESIETSKFIILKLED